MTLYSVSSVSGHRGNGGDFDDRPHDGDFRGDGIVDSLHRAPTPKMQEVKYLYQDLQIHVSDGKGNLSRERLNSMRRQ